MNEFYVPQRPTETHKLETLTLSNSDLDILRFVRKCNDEGDPITTDDTLDMDAAFLSSFRQMVEYGYIDWCEVADEIWYYMSEKGMLQISLSAGQLALPGLEGTLAELPLAAVFSVTKGFGIQVMTLEQPVECLVCHKVAAYSKERAGYPGLFHCTACGTWVDTVHGVTYTYPHHDQESS